ncbi:DUF2730 family protein [Ancylobacter sp. G4_0304]|uniref:DUF2730 family protein n=1 Tax=Ancylobacter sp. G4_0304 TaxID=3114289 RepID=UPI0039C5AD89
MEEFLLRWGPLLLAAFGLIYSIASSRGKAANDRVAKIETKLEEKASATTVQVVVGKLDIVEDRVSKVEGELKHLPDRDITHRLELAISKLEGRIEVMDERLQPVAEMAKRVQNRMFEEVRP